MVGVAVLAVVVVVVNGGVDFIHFLESRVMFYFASSDISLIEPGIMNS